VTGKVWVPAAAVLPTKPRRESLSSDFDCMAG
jgi:hypothetical protein